jgi:hypothetical protein
MIAPVCVMMSVIVTVLETFNEDIS